ncbi:MAG TPA: hypothetical protein PLD47_06395 [Aggregatilineales bacterium]|nr:hypothetical protein [Anaerolineales bacterium]HRE47340.1 hypothetical protein [Aggregatilineales bacterium]
MFLIRTIRRMAKRPFGLLTLVLMGAIFVLGLLNLGLVALRAADSAPDYPPRALIYVTTFDAFNEHWSTFPGQIRAEISDGVLVITSDSSNAGAFSLLNQQIRDFDLTVQTEWRTISSPADQIGVLFRYQNADNYYTFKIRSDGAYLVGMKAQGEDEIPLSQWQINPAIHTEPNATNLIQIIARRYTFEFYVNGIQLPVCPKGNDRRSTWRSLTSGECLSNGGRTRDQLAEATFEEGKIGVGMVAGDLGASVGFDNVIILGARPQ